MSHSGASLSAEGNKNIFSFPFVPYPQQERLMQSIHECVQSSSIGCFESPTGTGKSLSTICASLSWLLEEENRIIDKYQNEAQAKFAEDDWFQALLQPTQSDIKESNPHNNHREAVRVYREALQNISQSRISLKKGGSNLSWMAGKPNQVQHPKKSPPTSNFDVSPTTAEDEFILAPYYSDEEVRPNHHKDDGDDVDDDDDPLVGNNSEGEAWDMLGLPQIYYCSRTHTQLAQFVSEIKKTPFKSVRCVILSSRKSSCINSEVQMLRSDHSMNEKCLDLQRTKSSIKSSTDSSNKKMMLTSSSQSKCPYRNSSQEKAFANTLLNDLYDVEDLSTMGSERKVCTYYAARRAARKAQIVCMPYSTLFHSDVRDSVGLQLTKNHVVIIDEAHNLVETLNQIHSVELKLSSITNTATILKSYVHRFQSCLHGKNLFYLNLLLTVLKKLCAVLEGKVTMANHNGNVHTATNGPLSEESITSVNAFVFGAALDNINFLKLRKFLVCNNMINRIGGFAESLQVSTGPTIDKLDEIDVTGHSTTKSNLRMITAFITSLANQDEFGRISVRVPKSQKENGDEPIVKYVMLHAAATVQPIFDQVRSVLLLGGTMQPFQYFSTVLFPQVPPERLRFFSCNHIVDQSHVIARIINQGSFSNLGNTLEFTHERRLSIHTTSELFSIISSLAKTIPAGLVVFFTSYQYLQLVFSRWLSSGYLAKLQTDKEVFIESKDHPSDILWERYCKCIGRSKSDPHCRGGILFSVIGGRLSEGINFSDDLARGVVVVGMPYPDTRDLILQEKLSHFQSLNANVSGSTHINLPENMCMKAVNQAIGRSIRHIDDYAAIVLIDNRYCQTNVQSQLPAWIQDSLKVTSLKDCCTDLENFFLHKPSK